MTSKIDMSIIKVYYHNKTKTVYVVYPVREVYKVLPLCKIIDEETFSGKKREEISGKPEECDDKVYYRFQFSPAVNEKVYKREIKICLYDKDDSGSNKSTHKLVGQKKCSIIIGAGQIRYKKFEMKTWAQIVCVVLLKSDMPIEGGIVGLFWKGEEREGVFPFEPIIKGKRMVIIHSIPKNSESVVSLVEGRNNSVLISDDNGFRTIDIVIRLVWSMIKASSIVIEVGSFFFTLIKWAGSKLFKG
jgi:hypothetical protein